MAGDKFYHSKRWESLRRSVLRRDKYQCQYAKKLNKTIPVECVHHAFPRDEYPEYEWKPWNLISLSYKAHNMMHDRETNKLTQFGEELKREVAEANGIDTGPELILVIGNPGTGKTTYVAERLRSGIVYDLDWISGALRLTGPGKDDLKIARWIANDLLIPIVETARKYAKKIYIIRTAPEIEEIQDLDPSRLVVFYGNYNNEDIEPDRRTRIARRIMDAVKYARHNDIPLEEINCEERKSKQ